MVHDDNEATDELVELVQQLVLVGLEAKLVQEVLLRMAVKPLLEALFDIISEVLFLPHTHKEM